MTMDRREFLLAGVAAGALSAIEKRLGKIESVQTIISPYRPNDGKIRLMDWSFLGIPADGKPFFVNDLDIRGTNGDGREIAIQAPIQTPLVLLPEHRLELSVYVRAPRK